MNFAFKSLAGPADRYQVDYIASEPTILAAGGAVSSQTRLFAGAKKVSLLDGYAEELGIANFDLAIDFGWFYFLTKPFFYAINWLNSLLGNFGLAVLAFTIVVKLVFFPLANKSYRSMGKMRVLSPKIQEIRERHADDRMAMNQAMMALYKEEKVNPAAGCLPVLLQIPVFFALYKVLFVQPVRADAVLGRFPAALPAARRLADHDGPVDVATDAPEPHPAGPGTGTDLPVHADHLHLPSGHIPGRSGDLLDLEQHAFDGAAMVHSSQHSEGELTAAELEAGRLLFAGSCDFIAAANNMPTLPPISLSLIHI